MLVGIINKSHQEPEGHAFPGAFFRISIAGLVIGTEGTGKC